jgi:thymidylate synthase (FAD)
MKVSIIAHTQDADRLLVKVKDTRLMTSENIASKDEEDSASINEALHYISQTIKSSWEFVDYTFLIEGVSRAFTHQFVRNRTGSYAQQTMRMLDVDGFSYETGPTILADEEATKTYVHAMQEINKVYNQLIKMGVAVEDARGILPTNIHTNIIAKFNLRSLSDLVASRSSVRTQGEYRAVLDEMILKVMEIHPWADDFLVGRKFAAANQLSCVIGESNYSTEHKTRLHKALDALR